MLFVPPSFGQTGNSDTLYYYIDPLPDWANYAEGTVEKAFPYWENKHPGLKFVEVNTWEDANFAISWVKDFGGMHLGYAYGSEFIEIGLGDSNCLGSWLPFDQSSIIDTITHEVGHILGYDHSNNPNDIMYANAQFTQYDFEFYQFDTTSGYVYYQPVCSMRDVSTYDYELSIDDSNGFDFYFVPSEKEFDKYASGAGFTFYDDTGCYAENVVIYTDTCSGIANGGGLMIFTPDETDKPLVSFTIWLSEKSPPSYEADMSKASTTFEETELLKFKLDYLETNKNNYDFGETIEIRGKISPTGTGDISQGMRVFFAITDRLGEYVSVTQTFVTSKGEFFTIINIPEHKKSGEYTLSVYNSAFTGQWMGDLKFTIGEVVTEKIFAPETPEEEPYVPEKVEDLTRYENAEYGFTIKYPKGWPIDDSPYEPWTHETYDWGYSYALFCGEGYIEDQMCFGWNYYFEVTFYENEVNAMKYQGQTYLNALVELLRNDCSLTTVDDSGFDCSNYVTISSKILQIDGKQAYQVVRTWTETWPDSEPYRVTAITTDIVVGNHVWSLIIDSVSTEYPRMANAIEQMINSFDIIESGESLPSSVNDRVAPLILVPSDIEVEPDDQYGAIVEYTVKAIDDVDGVVRASCSPSSSSYFKIGTTTVNCYATDFAGNDAQKSFTITVTGETPSITPSSVVIPDWIKTTAGWWCNNEIEDSSFIEALQYLIKNDVIVVSAVAGAGSANEVPNWIKNNACWWSDGQIDDNTFATGIKYLIENGIVVV